MGEISPLEENIKRFFDRPPPHEDSERANRRLVASSQRKTAPSPTLEHQSASSLSTGVICGVPIVLGLTVFAIIAGYLIRRFLCVARKRQSFEATQDEHPEIVEMTEP